VRLPLKANRKYLCFKFITTSARFTVEYLGCCPLGVGFQVSRLTRVFQARLSEKRMKDMLIEADKDKGKA